jgi:hypothetical protein
MDEVEYFNKASEYLFSFDSLTNDMLYAHIDEWEKNNDDK